MALPDARHTKTANLLVITAGPVIWAAHFLMIYIYQAVMCHFGWAGGTLLGFDQVRVVIAAATALAMGLVAWIGLREWMRWRIIDQPPAENGRWSTRRLLSFAAWSAAGLSLVAIVWQAMPTFLMPVCR
jgi:hypothetical protein